VSTDANSDVDDVVVPLEAPDAGKPVKGLFPRSAILWGAGIFLAALAVLAARDALRSSHGAAPAAEAAASTPESSLGIQPNLQDIDKIAQRQIGAQEAADAAAAHRGTDQDGVSEQLAAAGVNGTRQGGAQGGGASGTAPAGTVQPNVPYPSHPSPMGNVGADAAARGTFDGRGTGAAAGAGGRYSSGAANSGGAYRGGSSGGSTGGGTAVDGVDTAAVEGQVTRRMGAMVSLSGDDDSSGGGVAGAIKSAVSAAQQATGAGAGSTSSDSVKQMAELTKNLIGSGNSGSGSGNPTAQVLNATAAVAHPTARDVAWLKDYSEEPSKSASGADSGLSPASRAKNVPTKNLVVQGTQIPVVSREAVNSDQPGSVTAWSTSPIYDSFTQTKVLIPAGTRFFGRYSSEIRAGQTRLLFAYNRMMLPDGRSVDLMGAQGGDNLGRAGVEGRVDNHFLEMFGYSLAIGWIGNKVGNSGTTTTTTGSSGTVSTETLAGQVAGQVAQSILQRNASIPPTIYKEAGSSFTITITGDIALEPWKTQK
jgi:type IV secretory pathway VirB10-like protein